MKEKIQSIVESNLTNEEKIQKLYELFKTDVEDIVVCMVKGIIEGSYK